MGSKAVQPQDDKKIMDGFLLNHLDEISNSIQLKCSAQTIRAAQTGINCHKVANILSTNIANCSATEKSGVFFCLQQLEII
jgi:hypothetical protein